MSTKVSKSKKPSRQSAAAKVTKKTTKAVKATTIKTTTTEAYNSLKKLHIISVVLYLLLAVLAFTVMKNTSYQLTIGYLAKDALQTSKTGSAVFGPAARGVYDIQLRYAIGAIMILSAIVPVLYLTKFKNKYELALKNKVSPWRWIDLGVTMALVVEVVALISGLSDIPTLKIVGGLIAVTCALGWVGEKRSADNRKSVISIYTIGVVTGILPWLIIIPYAIATIVYGSLAAPWYIYVVYLTTLIAAIGLAINQYKQYGRAKKWQYYSNVERNYVLLGLFGKVAFAAILIVGLVK